MNGEWCVFNKKFNKEYCEYIVTEANKIPKQPAKIGINNELVTTEHRKSQIAFINRDMPGWEGLFDELWKMACQANDQWFNFHISKFDYIQFAEYHSNIQGEYKKHHDIFYMNNDPKYHRKLSMVIQLTDPNEYEGGDLELYNLSAGEVNKEMFRNQGSVILFPSFTEHAALPVTKGIRYSMAVWFDGPKWR
jgi:PKHD-type hydroxylase